MEETGRQPAKCLQFPGSVGDERHMLLECPALADLRERERERISLVHSASIGL